MTSPTLTIPCPCLVALAKMNNPPPAQPALSEKQRKLRLDHKLLLSERGFKYLRQNSPIHDTSTSTFQRLDSIMKLYREWAHYAYPAYRFEDFIAKVERECANSKPLKMYIEALRRSCGDGDFDEAAFLVQTETSALQTALNQTRREETENIEKAEDDIEDNIEDEGFNSLDEFIE